MVEIAHATGASANWALENWCFVTRSGCSPALDGLIYFWRILTLMQNGGTRSKWGWERTPDELNTPLSGHRD